jgi:site-specific DNA recombinase
MVKTIRAASYIRMSTDKQETSPEQQREAINKLAAEHGYTITQNYQDLGISGDATHKRLGFQQMIADGSARCFDAVLCWDQDRFGRFDLIEAGRWIEPLRNAGVSLHTVTGGKIDWLTLTGQLGYMASQMGKAQYLRDLSANVRRGQDRVEKAGKWTRGFPPFGYTVDDDGRLVPADAKEVRLLKAIFQRYSEGNSYREICAWLTAQGVKTKRGNDWQSQSIRHTLNNLVYRGQLVYGKSSASKFLPHGTPDGSRSQKPEDAWRVRLGNHEALVTQELFDLCQKRKKENKNMTGPKSKNRFALTGLLFCSHCGSRLCGSTDSIAPSFKRYICIDYANARGNCERRTVREDAVLSQVLKAIRTEFIEPFFGNAEREAIKDRMRGILLDSQSENERDRVATQTRLATTDAELDQAINAMLSTSEDLRHLVEKRVRMIQDERDKLVDRLARNTAPAAEQIARAEERIDAVIGWMDRLEELATTNCDPVPLARVLREFIERIDVDIEKVPRGTKLTSSVLRGGQIYFRAESFPAWVVPTSTKLASLPQPTLC